MTCAIYIIVITKTKMIFFFKLEERIKIKVQKKKKMECGFHLPSILKNTYMIIKKAMIEIPEQIKNTAAGSFSTVHL